MTQEEKAKAYDAALERFKSFKEKYYTKDTNLGDIIFDKTGEMQKDFESIFPQLAESEDERIRKAIIKSIEEDSSVYEQEVTKEQMLTYLEKQKYDRMKPIYDARESFESALAKAWKEYNDSGSRTVDGCEDNYAECAHAKGFREGYLFGIKKQKEQTLSEWNANDMAFIKDCARILNENGYAVSAERLLSMFEQKSVWSEEDMSFYDSIICEVIKEGMHPTPEQAHWLKSLPERFNPQPKQKWSEEDEKNLENIRLFLLHHEEDAWAYTITKLKSRHPFWKPTCEQLDALKRAIHKLANTEVADSVRLSILYDHLKELM